MNTVTWQTPLSSQALSPLLQSDDLPMAAPGTGSWGYYLELGQDMGYFSWFPDQSQMLRHLGHVEILHLPTLLPERADYEALVARLIPLLQDYVNQWESDSTEAGARLLQRYQAVVPQLKLSWVGPVSALRSEESPFAQKLRQAFQAQHAQDATQASETVWESFLADYGL